VNAQLELIRAARERIAHRCRFPAPWFVMKMEARNPSRICFNH
jgi:hypothetical protein